MELVLPDTDLTLPSGSASASRCTYTFANALIGAAEILKERILQRSADMLMARGAEELALIPGGVRRLTDGRELSLEFLAQVSQRIGTDSYLSFQGAGSHGSGDFRRRTPTARYASHIVLLRGSFGLDRD